MEPPWMFMRRSPSRKRTHTRKNKIPLKARQINASLRETDADKEIDGCAGRERKQQITHGHLKQLKGKTVGQAGRDGGRRDGLKTPHALLKGSFRALQVMEVRRWRARFIPVRGS